VYVVISNKLVVDSAEIT